MGALLKDVVNAQGCLKGGFSFLGWGLVGSKAILKRL